MFILREHLRISLMLFLVTEKKNSFVGVKIERKAKEIGLCVCMGGWGVVLFSLRENEAKTSISSY